MESLAEVKAGRRPFVRWALGPDHAATKVDVGSCSKGFGSLALALEGATVTQVGDSRWTMLSARESLGRLTSMIEEFPNLTSCDDAGCDRCRDAIAGGPIG